MDNIGEIIHRLHSELPSEVTLVAVSKFHPIEALQSAYDAGQRVFGESRVQELCAKFPQMPSDVEWHFIGHLQTNKVRQILPYVSLIHSGDSIKLLETINTEAQKMNRVVDLLLEIHVAKEDTKYGFSPAQCEQMVIDKIFERLPNIRVRGVMGMATNTDDENEIAQEFDELKSVFDRLKLTAFADKDYFTIVSMGMSHDYKLAIQHGSNMVRIGTTIFGEREY